MYGGLLKCTFHNHSRWEHLMTGLWIAISSTVYLSAFVSKWLKLIEIYGEKIGDYLCLKGDCQIEGCIYWFDNFWYLNANNSELLFNVSYQSANHKMLSLLGVKEWKCGWWYILSKPSKEYVVFLSSSSSGLFNYTICSGRYKSPQALVRFLSFFIIMDNEPGSILYEVYCTIDIYYQNKFHFV